jgi:hypothetical protein
MRRDDSADPGPNGRFNTDRKERGYQGVELTEVAHNKAQWRLLANMVMGLAVL